MYICAYVYAMAHTGLCTRVGFLNDTQLKCKELNKTSKVMQRKRFKLVKANESVKPLHPRSTNVKTPSVETKVKQPLKRSIDQSSQQTKKRKGETHASKEKVAETVFDNDHVQLKFSEPSPRAVSPPRRLGRTEEEGSSLQLDDFDQPPESTSTPVKSSRDSRRGSPLFHNGFTDDLPPYDKYWEQQQPQMFSYMPFGFIPQYQFQSAFPLGYNHGITPAQPTGSSMGAHFPMSMGFPVGYSIPQPPAVGTYMRNYVYGPGSQSSSYKSSGGEATYRGSDRS